MTDAPAPTEDAYSLLTRPTLEITDEQLEIIVANLRARRAAYMAGTADRPDKPKAASAAPKTAAEKDALTKALLGELDLKL
jgi:tartrate dehydratase beta subunit/fumarate hydratase class I family protein